MDELKLAFIVLVGMENDGNYLYEALFTSNEDELWGDGFEYKPCCLYNGLKPNDDYIDLVMTFRTDIKLDLIQNNCCFGMQDALDGIVSIAYESLDGLDEYPQDGRLYFMFGEPYSLVARKLAKKNILLEEKEDAETTEIYGDENNVEDDDF